MFLQLRPGGYTVTVSLQGFATARVENVEMQLGQIRSLDRALAVGAGEDSVVLRAGGRVVDVRA